MATTTNYGWTTPDDTALVKDGAAAIRTLGSSVDTTTKALNPSTTLGDIEYRSSTANTNTRLGIGTTGQILTVSGGVPAWVAPAGGGKILQVVTATTSTATTIASTSYTDTTISATITPSSASSKVLILISGFVYYRRSSFWQGVGIKLVRTSTDILTNNSANYTDISGVGAVDRNTGISIIYVDSPNTTSSTTYKLQGNIDVTTNSGTSTWQNTSQTSTITLLEIGA
jgi:hypothetical protein